MDVTLSWRIIGDWVITLGISVPILDLIKPDELQAALRQEWPDCRVTYDRRAWASLIVREVPYVAAEPLLRCLAQLYPVHPVTSDRIRWTVGPMIG